MKPEETGINLERLKEQLILHEGYRDKVYYDTKGHPTVGVGFNLDRKTAISYLRHAGAPSLHNILRGERLSRESILALLGLCIDESVLDAKSLISNFDSLDEVRKRVVVDMAFNMGRKVFSQFRNTIKAIEESRWEDAAAGMEGSRWYKQTKTRARRLVKMIRTGEDFRGR